MKKFKRIIPLIILMGMLLCSCNATKSDFKDDKKVLESALDKLKSTDKYIISNQINAPDSDVYYLTVNTPDGCYTEYPVDADGNYGTLSYKDVTASQEYILTDYWVDSSNFYFIGQDEDDNSIAYKYPESYASKLANRKIMYFDEMLNNFTDIKYKEEKEIDLGTGLEKLKLYECTLPSEYMTEFFGKANKALYESVLGTTDNTNIKNLCEYYLEDYDTSLTFSSANVLVGVDASGMLRYVDIMVGGLGSKMYCVMSVITNDFEARTTPDFDGVTDYAESMQNVADFVANYDSVDEGLSALMQDYTEKISNKEVENEN